MESPRVRRFARTTAPQPTPPIPANEPIYRSTTMATTSLHTATSTNTSGWITFAYAQFGAAVFMTAVGLWAMPVDLMVKGYLMMSSVFLIGSTFTLAKTVRDEHEAKRFAARLEEARTEKLLMEVGRGA